MNNFRFSTEDREPARAYTPSHTSDEDLPGVSNLSLSDKSYRLFSFRKEGRSWVNSICTESRLPENDIKKRAKRQRKPTHGVDHQLERMSPPRRHAIEELLEKTNRKDPDGLSWDIAAIDNANPDLTKRTGEVTAFSVILARANAVRQGPNPVSRERRRSTYRSSEEDYNVIPNRRESRPYGSGRISPTREDKNARQSQAYMHTKSILEEDPFGAAQLFSSDGKPVGASGSAMYGNAALPPHITQDEPIGAPVQKEKNNAKKTQKPQKTDLWQADDMNDGVIDLDALLGGTMGGTGKKSNGKMGNPKTDFDKLIDDDFEFDHHDDHHDDFEMPMEIIGGPKEKPRGRKQAQPGWKTNTQQTAGTQPKSKSRTRPLSLSIPKGQYDRRDPPPEVISAGRRKEQPYWSSRETANSVPSDQSVLEAEYEDYSSSGSSAGFEPDWQQGDTIPTTYQSADSRYQQATNYHRRGPPSPQQPRYDAAYEQQYAQRRPPRAERFPSDSAVQRYSYTPQAAKRPPIVSQASAPRFTPTPTSAHPGIVAMSGYTNYGYDSGLTPYPAEVGNPNGLRRRDSVQAQDAEHYMRREREQAREIELLQRERDLARREAELHQEVARRASVSQRPGSKYNHEPRLNRRYTTYNN